MRRYCTQIPSRFHAPDAASLKAPPRLQYAVEGTLMIAPKAEIRRFDVFAEWNRLKAVTQLKMPESEARTYGLAVAKVVAARKLHGYKPKELAEFKRQARTLVRPEEITIPWWHRLASPEEFERKIIERMGRAFYEQVFQPAIARAWREGKSYEEIRDSLRQQWNQLLT